MRGQYGAGVVDGRARPGVPRASRRSRRPRTTETYVALKLYVDNWRWAGVPFYLRTGKRLPGAGTEIAIQFRRPPLLLLDRAAMRHIDPNRLVIQIQPDEGIEVQVQAKRPGPTVQHRDR